MVRNSYGVTEKKTESIVVNPTSTTTYSVQVSNGSCYDEDQVKVTVRQQVENSDDPTIDAGEDQTLCLGESIRLTAKGGDNYLWSNGQSGSQIIVSPLRTETYEVTSSRNGVTVSDSVTITVENCVSSSDEPVLEEEDIQIILYPNPTTGIVKIQSNSARPETDVHLINTNGKILYQDTMKSQQGNFNKQLDLSNFTKGVYFLRFLNEEKQLVKKIVLI